MPEWISDTGRDKVLSVHTNPSVILVAGVDNDGRIYIIKELYQSRLTDAELAQIAKEEFGYVETFFCDSENPSGIQELVSKGIHAIGVEKKQGEKRENFVTWGIKLVARMLEPQGDGKPRLYVDKRCVNTIMEFENYRYPDNKDGRPEQEQPLKVHDHCLIGDTDIITSRGIKKIKEINPGDKVLTRKGFKNVLKSGITIRNSELFEVKTTSGKILIGTNDHKIYTDSGFICMDALSNKYKLKTPNNLICELLKSMAGNLQKLKDTSIGKTRNSDICIGISGKERMKKYQTVMKYITKMEIRVTTILEILKSLDTSTMPKDTIGETNQLYKQLRQLKDGIRAQKVSGGINVMQKNNGKENNQRLNLADFAEKCSNIIQGLIFAQSNVRQHNIEERIVSAKKIKRKEDVYDLTIEGCHEFFANGILVHNSMDALRYLVVSLEKPTERMALLEDPDGVFWDDGGNFF